MPRRPTPAAPASEGKVEIESLATPGDEDVAVDPAPESPESSPSGEDDWVKVAKAAPEPVDALIKPSTVPPDTDTVLEVSVPVELVGASASGEGDGKVVRLCVLLFGCATVVQGIRICSPHMRFDG